MVMRIPAASDPPRYEPLDELLDRPRTRLLRAFARFEWMSAFDLFDAIDLPEHNRPNHVATLLVLQRRGYLKRRGSRRRGVEYRITNLGRRELARILEVANPERDPISAEVSA
jgi:DNA-binding IclR family transcriptional regulator